MKGTGNGKTRPLKENLTDSPVTGPINWRYFSMFQSEISMKTEGIADMFLDSHDAAIGRAEDNLIAVAGDSEQVQLALDRLALETCAAWFKVAKASFLSGLAHGHALATGE